MNTFTYGFTPTAYMRTHPATNKGFTLLEILVAMVVLTLILSSAFGALRLGDRSWEAGLERASESENLRTVSGVLQWTFSQILPLSWREKTRKYIAFKGDSDHVSFIAPAPLHHGATGLFEYTLLVEPQANAGKRLVMYYRLHDPDSYTNDTGIFDTGSDDSQLVVLVENLKTASFAYYGSPLADDEPRWHRQWNNDAETYPGLVKARLVMFDEQRQWPELLLTLHADRLI